MIKKNIVFVLTIAISALFISACSSKEPGEELELPIEMNESILKIMQDNYYWNLPDPTPSLMTEVKSYFNKLLNSGDNYSWIKSVVDIPTEPTANYGIGFHYAAYEYSDGNMFYIVLYVQRGSVAEKLGIKRGYVITGVSETGREADVKDITKENYETLLSGCINSGKEFAMRIIIPDGQEGAFTYQEGKTLVSPLKNEDPLYYSNADVLPGSGKKIGYIVYNHFLNSPNDKNEYQKALIRKLNDFREAGVTSLILDLRYCAAGGFDFLSPIGSSLVKTADQGGGIFARLVKENESKDRSYPFISSLDGTSIDNLGNQLNDIYVITGKTTAGPAETLIHALRAYWGDNLKTVGDDSQGKNMALSSLVTVKNSEGNPAYGLQILLGYFADKNRNFAYQVVPNSRQAEVNSESGTTEMLKPLGDKNEYVLAQTLANITGNTTLTSKVRSSGQPVTVKYLGSSIKIEPGVITLDNLQ